MFRKSRMKGADGGEAALANEQGAIGWLLKICVTQKDATNEHRPNYRRRLKKRVGPINQ